MRLVFFPIYEPEFQESVKIFFFEKRKRFFAKNPSGSPQEVSITKGTAHNEKLSFYQFDQTLCPAGLFCSVGRQPCCLQPACRFQCCQHRGQPLQRCHQRYRADCQPVDCATLADAAALTGYDFTVPDSVDGCTDVAISVLESEQLTEVQYTAGNDRLCLRKAPSSDDISGDYNQYAENSTVDVDGRSVTLQGNGGQVQLATWQDGSYSYSIGVYREDGTGLTTDEMTALVKVTG